MQSEWFISMSQFILPKVEPVSPATGFLCLSRDRKNISRLVPDDLFPRDRVMILTFRQYLGILFDKILIFSTHQYQSIPMQATPYAERPKAPQPEGVDITQEGGSLRIIYRWWSWKFAALLVFCIVWDSFLVFWYSKVTENAPLIMILFPVGHVLVGLSLTYYTIAGFLNRTIIMVNRQFLIVTHTPMPWFGNRRLETEQVTQLYAEEIIFQSRNSQSASYQVNTILRGNRKQKLLSGLPSQDIALFVEQTIEKYLRIPDEPVAGEIYKPKI